MFKEFFKRGLLKLYISNIKYYVQIMEKEELDYDSLQNLGMELGLTDYMEKELGASETTLFKIYLDKYDTRRLEVDLHYSYSATPAHCWLSAFMMPMFRDRWHPNIGVKYLYRGSKERVELARLLIEKMTDDYNSSLQKTLCYRLKKLLGIRKPQVKILYFSSLKRG